MYSYVISAMLCGISGNMVRVEADISSGLPVFDVVGLAGSEVKESKERVRTALRNCGYTLPPSRITVNLSPANIRKTGNGFDLPIAIAILLAMQRLKNEHFAETVVIGEMGLFGQIQPVNGVLSMVLKAKEEGFSRFIVPKDNVSEALLVPEITVYGVENIQELVELINYGAIPEEKAIRQDTASSGKYNPDFANMNGQLFLRRACEIAASGMHNILMIGPPGAGKTMAAKCLPSILPEMTLKEQIEVSKIYSACGLLDSRQGLMTERPFRNPHHTISDVGLTGGGLYPKPGELSLANSGILFLDELPEFRKSTLEVLRQPMEEKRVHISRAYGNYIFPADFMLVAAMNPCPCGYYPDPVKCRCDRMSVSRYLGRISQPLLDRIDICTDVENVSFHELTETRINESSAEIRKRVEKVHELQHVRYEKESFLFNSQIPSELVDTYCSLDSKERDFMAENYDGLGLTARTYHKVLKVARTIADMEGSPDIQLKHLKEALHFRGIDKKFWEVRGYEV